MDLSSSGQQAEFSGGIFQHVPFQGTEWVWKFAQSGFTQTSVVVMLVFIGLTLFFILGFLLHTLARPAKTRAPKSLSENRQLLDECSESALPKTLDCLSLDERVDRDGSADFWNLVSADLKEELARRRNTSDGTDEFLGPLKLMDGSRALENASAEQSHSRNPSVEQTIQSSTSSTTTSKKEVKFQRRVVLLASLSALFVICLIGHVVSLTMAVRSERRIADIVQYLPVMSRLLARNVGEFGNFSLDSLFNLTCVHIINDASRTDNESRLQHLVNHAKQLAAEAVACLVLECRDETSHDLELFAPNDSDTSLANSLLHGFDVIIGRINRLNRAALVLNSEFIHSVTRAWYTYQKGLWSISSTTAIPESPFSQQPPEVWKQYPWFNRTYNVICEHLSRKTLNHFSSCDQISQFLHDLLNYTTNVPLLLPSKSLDTVIQYTFIPRALGVQDSFEQWLPVMTDLSGQGALFLLRTYLKPELQLLKTRLDVVMRSVPTTELTLNVLLYGHMFDSAMIIVFVLCAVCGLSVFVFIITLIIRQAKKHHKCFHHSCDRLNKTDSTLFRSARKHSSIPSILITLCVLVFLSLILALIGAVFGYASGLVESQLCVYLFNGQAQTSADKVLTERLKVAMGMSKTLSAIKSIPHLNPTIPYPILNTLDSEYSEGHRSLIQSLHWENPANFTALLSSGWFNTTLNQLWDVDVRNKLFASDVSSKIPKLSLTDIFNQAKKTTKLENSFDQLHVGNVTDFLNDPGPPFFRKLSETLEKINSAEALHLAAVYKKLDTLQMTYATKYTLVDETLATIDMNKIVIGPVSTLIANASIALDNLNKMSNIQIIRLLDQVVSVGWPRIQSTVYSHLIPFLLNLLSDLIPFPGLRAIYHQTVSPICLNPNEPSHTSTELSSSPSSYAVSHEMRHIGTGLFVSAFSLILAMLLSILLF
ncbi:hypothetical protein PHET_10688 [Paragonimus heterotremus]|uniref:Uncharacterized protein n=1 Tax=Paragonimus heterotremus TaxID=100268 RepID=A0A8J4WMZ3_9TREM|nr:hypothetical protein PHET_10688 [Paragonimus heterotremus]